MVAMVLLTWLCASPALAAPPAYATAERIAAALNARDAAALSALIDTRALARRAFADIDLGSPQRADAERGVANGMQQTVQNLIARIERDHGTAMALRGAADTDSRSAIVRIIMRDADDNYAGSDYLVFDLDRRGRIVDWTSHATGLRMSATLGRLLSTLLDERGVIARLFGRMQVDADALATMREIGERTRAADPAAVYTLLERLPAAFRATADWAALRVNAASQLDEARYRDSLEHVARHHGEDARFTFMLVDHHVYRKDYPRALAAVARMERQVAADGLTRYLACGIELEAEHPEPARSACSEGIRREPALKDNWWLLIGIANQQHDAALTLDTLSAYERQFDMAFDPDALVKLEAYRWLAGNERFESWAAARRDDPAGTTH